MAKLKIPLRPNTKNNYELNEDAMDCIVWTIISNRPRIETWMMFVSPEAQKQIKAKREEACDAWWSQSNVKQFIKDYRQALADANNPQKKNIARDKEKEADDALNTFRDNVINAVNTEGITDVETLADQATLLNRIGMLKDEEEVQVAPIRYLPQACNDSCVYRLFCEKGIQNGDIINECDYCKALKFAKENGYIYDPTKLLDLPKEETKDNN